MQNETNRADEKQKVSGAGKADKLTAAPPEPEPAAEDEEATPTERADESEEPAAEATAPEAPAPDGEQQPAAAAAEPVAPEPEEDGKPAEGEAAAPEAEAEPTEPAEPAEAEAAEAPEPDPSAGLAAAKAEAEAYLDDLRRLQAEFDNYRKRTLREQTARAAAASQALVTRLLPVLDNFELAVSAAEQSRDFDRMLKGVEMVFGAIREVLQGEGLVKIEAEGKPFDPERHEAVVAVEQEGVEPGTVVDVVRTGYELRGRVLRPAMVKVAR